MYPPATDKHSPACSVAHCGPRETFTFRKDPYWTQGVEFNLRQFVQFGSVVNYCGILTSRRQICVYVHIVGIMV
jgi:hypothetical protein